MALLPVNATGFCSFIRSPYKGIRPGVISRSTGPGGSAPAGTVSNPLPKPCHERRLGKHPPLRASRKSHFTPLHHWSVAPSPERSGWSISGKHESYHVAPTLHFGMDAPLDSSHFPQCATLLLKWRPLRESNSYYIRERDVS